MSGSYKKSRDYLRSVFMKKSFTTMYRWLFVGILLSCFSSGCATTSVSMQPEIKSTDKGALNDYDRMNASSSASDVVADLPEMNAASHEAIGDAMMARGDFQSAYSHYKNAFEKDTGRNQSRLEYKQGMAFLYADQYEAALDRFESVLSRDPDYAAAHQEIGRIHLRRGQLEEAKMQFEKALALDTGLWQSYNSLGTIYDSEGEWQQAEDAYKCALAVNPREGSVLNNLGMSYLLAGKDELAVQTFETAIQTGFTESRVFNNLGLALARAGHFDEALQAFKSAGGEAAAYNNLGCVHLKSGRRRMAIECFEKAMALDPKFYVTANDNLKIANMSGNAELGEIQ